MPYYLGIDGGATKTTCAVARDAATLAIATTGSSNIVRVGEPQTRVSLESAIQQACAAAGITPAQISYACIGVAGAARPETATLIRAIATGIISSSIQIVGDMQIALEAAFSGGPGVIVIAGSGSIAYGRDHKGKIARSGGWGFALSDQGSAFWIGRAAAAAALRSLEASQYDGRPLPASAEAVLKALRATSLDELIGLTNSTPPPDYAALLPVVLASEDDATRPILMEAGRKLAQLASAVVGRLFGGGKPAASFDSVDSAYRISAVPMAIAGGVFRHAALVRETFYNELAALEPRAAMKAEVVDPVQGALFLARQLAEKGAGQHG